jgi:methyl-accepting chemotaxis protein
MLAKLSKPSVMRAVILPVAAVLAGITGLIVIVIASRVQSKTAENLLEKSTLIARVVQPNVSAAVWKFDTTEAYRILHSISSDKDFRSAIIVDDKGKNFASYQALNHANNGEVLTLENVAALFGGSAPKDFRISEPDNLALADLIVIEAPLFLAEKTEQDIGYIALAFSRERAIATTQNAFMMVISGGLFALILACGLLASILIRVTRPIRDIADTTTRLSAGELDIAIPAVDRKDEIGVMARALCVFRDTAAEREKLERSAKTEMVKREARSQQIDALVGCFRNDVRGVLAAVIGNTEQMALSANILSDIAAQNAAGAKGAAKASQEVSNNVQGVATTAEELSASISEIGMQAGRARDIATGAVSRAGVTSSAIEGLATHVEEIRTVVDLINNIAAQTNLLALNATIEAARAGDAGRGFSVVAGEVKALANQTARATDEISARISAIRTSTLDSVSAIGEISKTIVEIEAHSRSIADAVEQQQVATGGISRNVTDAAKGTNGAVSEISKLVQMVGETDQTAGQVRLVSLEIAENAEKLQTVIDSFLKNVA